jgi:hypothetical protein
MSYKIYSGLLVFWKKFLQAPRNNVSKERFGALAKGDG